MDHLFSARFHRGMAIAVAGANIHTQIHILFPLLPPHRPSRAPCQLCRVSQRPELHPHYIAARLLRFQRQLHLYSTTNNTPKRAGAKAAARASNKLTSSFVSSPRRPGAGHQASFSNRCVFVLPCSSAGRLELASRRAGRHTCLAVHRSFGMGGRLVDEAYGRMPLGTCPSCAGAGARAVPSSPSLPFCLPLSLSLLPRPSFPASLSLCWCWSAIRRILRYPHRRVPLAEADAFALAGPFRHSSATPLFDLLPRCRPLIQAGLRCA